MAVRMGGSVDFSECHCQTDFDDLIELLDGVDDDDVIPELEDWGYPIAGDDPIDLKLPCGGTVSLEWDLGLGVIRGGRC